MVKYVDKSIDFEASNFRIQFNWRDEMWVKVLSIKYQFLFSIITLDKAIFAITISVNLKFPVIKALNTQTSIVLVSESRFSDLLIFRT